MTCDARPRRVHGSGGRARARARDSIAEGEGGGARRCSTQVISSCQSSKEVAFTEASAAGACLAKCTVRRGAASALRCRNGGFRLVGRDPGMVLFDWKNSGDYSRSSHDGVGRWKTSPRVKELRPARKRT